jgi:hypothetical protein
MNVRPGTHYPHVTWVHVMLRVQLGYFNIEFWRTLTLLSTLLTSCDLTWSSGRLTCQHASQISVVAHISWEGDVTYVTSHRPELRVRSRDVSRVDWSVSLRQNSMLNTPTALVILHELTWREDSLSPTLLVMKDLDLCEFVLWWSLLALFRLGDV